MTVTILKPPSARKELAAAISLAAGAKRDARVADEAARQAAQNCWEAQSRLEKLREAAEPSGSLADTFAASVAAGNPCNAAVLERSGIDARAKITATENEVRTWDATRWECDESAREKEAAVMTARERVERAARVVICDSETVANLVDELTGLQSEVVSRRAVLRFIWGKGINGELPRPLVESVQRLLQRDLLGLESTSASAAWQAAFEELQSNSDAKLPS
jgi:hypothetical protein